jgi:hypothetical protein
MLAKLGRVPNITTIANSRSLGILNNIPQYRDGSVTILDKSYCYVQNEDVQTASEQVMMPGVFEQLDQIAHLLGASAVGDQQRVRSIDHNQILDA